MNALNSDYQKQAKSLLEEFKAFALKGNVVDLAIAVVVGGAFGKIVSSLANNIIMPLAGAALGGITFNNLSFRVGEAEVSYGIFLQAVIDFAIVAVAIFAFIKLMSVIKQKEESKPDSEKVVTPNEEVLLLREIRDTLKNN